MPKVRYVALSSRVLAVAKEGGVKDWSAYIDAVPGISHKDEWENVLAFGNKLPKDIAELLFPEFAQEFRWRD